MYNYKVRPGYGSQELLIELTPKSADEEFFRKLWSAIEVIGVKVNDVLDLWMNDEVVLACESDWKEFQKPFFVSFASVVVHPSSDSDWQLAAVKPGSKSVFTITRTELG